ncbi:MAG: multicopper oxidase domain-containing protein [Polyangiaceae bacterium]|nr:multicopper oxidase domain-containing protein [Polyangiaceae bacterium]
MSGRFLQEDTTDPTGDALTPEEILQVASNGDLVAIVNVTSAAGTPTETQMPDLDAVAAESPTMMLQGGAVDALARCEEAATISEPSEIEQLSFMWPIFTNQEGFDDCACPDHNLNCKNFETTDRDKYPYDRVLTVGDVDHWRLMSGFDGHPFHIHINPFLVCPVPEDGPTAKEPPVRAAVRPLARHLPGELRPRGRRGHQYRSYAGSYVYHCHKLTHEDHGMMENHPGLRSGRR